MDVCTHFLDQRPAERRRAFSHFVFFTLHFSFCILKGLEEEVARGAACVPRMLK